MDRQKLEKFFSSRNGSAIFPVLANLYYDQKLYKYATKVCELGLAQDPNNLEGKYIFAKSLLIQSCKLFNEMLPSFPNETSLTK